MLNEWTERLMRFVLYELGATCIVVIGIGIVGYIEHNRTTIKVQQETPK